MNPLGINALILTRGWGQDQLEEAIEQAAAAGYSHIEIPLHDLAAIEPERISKALEKAGIRPVCSLGLDAAHDISSGDPSQVKRGEALLLEALVKTRDMGADLLTGVLYSAQGYHERAASPAGRWNCARSLARIAMTAAASALTIGLKPVNRYESNLLNTADQTVALIDQIGCSNVVVHLSSYHANIEEGPIEPIIERLGALLGYVHLCESHRGQLGTGNVDLEGWCRALIAHRYEGIITFDARTAESGDPRLNERLAIWQSPVDPDDDIAVHALGYLKERLGQPSSDLSAGDQVVEMPDDTGRALIVAEDNPDGDAEMPAAERTFGFSRQS